MRTRTILWGAVGIVSVAIAVAVALSIVDLSRYKERIVAGVEQATGRSLTVGEMALHVFPVPTLSAKNVALSNVPGSAVPQIVTIGDLSAHVDLKTLLIDGQLRVTELQMNDVAVDLETDASGHGNWSAAAPAAAPTAQPLSGADAGAGLPSPDFQDATLRKLVVTYHDIRTKLSGTVPIESIKLARGGTADFDMTIDGSAGLSSAPYHVTATVSGSPDTAIAFKSLHGTIGASSFSGDGSLTLGGPRPKLTATLTSPALDFTQFEPAAPAAPKKSRSEDHVFSDAPLPANPLRGLDGDITLKVAKLKTRNDNFSNVSAHLILADRNLQAAPFALDIDGSHVSGKASLSMRQTPPTIDVDITANDIDVGKLANSLSRHPLLDGKGDVSIVAQGKGDSLHAIMASLNGDTSLAVGQGTIKNGFVDLVGADVFNNAFALKSGKQSAVLNCMVLRFDTRNGLATSRGILIDTEDVTMTGHGTIDLGSEKIALELTPRPKNWNPLSLPVTVDVGGTLAKPTAQSSTVLIAKDIAVDVAKDATSPATDLAPALLGSGQRNPCLRALDKDKPQAVPGNAAQQAPPPQENPGVVERLFNGIGHSLGSIFKAN